MAVATEAATHLVEKSKAWNVWHGSRVGPESLVVGTLQFSLSPRGDAVPGRRHPLDLEPEEKKEKKKKKVFVLLFDL